MEVRTEPESSPAAPQSKVVIPEHPTIYLLNSRPWLYKLQAASLAAVTDDQLDKLLASACADVIWLQGPWEVGPWGRTHDLSDDSRRKHFEDCLPGDFQEDDCIGSPYAITQYVLDPSLGSERDLKTFRERLATRGVALMLDFVPNHTARDSPWIRQPGLFVEKEGGEPACGRDPYSGDWTDTAQLNYWSPACREFMLKQLLNVAEQCDGLRVDMAMLCCNAVIERTWGSQLLSKGLDRPKEEFWEQAIQKVRERYPKLFFLAECYEYEQIFPDGTGKELIREGFDAVYDKVLYDKLKESHLDHIRCHLFDSELLRQGRLCHFTENHDEERAAVHFGDRSPAAAVASLTLPGPRLIMWGQERGLRARLAVHLRRAALEEDDVGLRDFYDRLLPALHRCRGEWRPLSLHGDAAWRLLAWGWHSDKTSVVVVTNYTDEEAWANATVDWMLPEGGNGTAQLQLKDLLTDAVYERSAEVLRGPEGLVLGLPPFHSHVLVYNA